MLNEFALLPADAARKRTGRLLVVALGASIVLHAALLGFLPGFIAEQQAPVRLSELEVVMRVPAEPQPPAAEEPTLQPGQVTRARPAAQQQQRETTAAAVQSGSPPRPEVALPGSSDARAEPDRSPEAATAARAAEPMTTVPAEKVSAPEAPAARAVANAAYLDTPAPRYPETARRLGQEGTVMLRVLVTADGVAARVALERSSGSPQLDGAALERVRNWRFRPARQGSAPVESWVIVPIVFRLESTS